MSNTWFAADLHFGHVRVIDYENRPYDSVEEMDESLIANWNSCVQENDEVYVLGDYSFYEFEKTREITQRLNGKKYLVMGNHDTHNEAYYRDCGFESSYSKPIIFQNFWMLSHEPLYINGNMPYANIFGHVHGCASYANFSKQSFCVCVERLSYKPISFTMIKEMIKTFKP